MQDIETVIGLDEARALTEDIRHRAKTVARSLEELRELVERARVGEVHLLLGYTSWTAYIADVLGEQPMRLERDARRELVGMLTEQGMSTRAIAPIVGASQRTVADDARAAAEQDCSPAAEPARVEDVIAAIERASGVAGPPLDPPMIVVEATGEILADAQDPDKVRAAALRVAAEHDAPQPAEPARVQGLDGKSYPVPAPARQRRRALPDTAETAGFDLRRGVERVMRLRDDDRFEANRTEVAARLRGHVEYAIRALQGLLDGLNDDTKGS